MTRRAVIGTTYLIHFDRPYRHARHYTGWASDLYARIAAHERGEGARLLAVVNAAGIGWHVARTWPETTRADERRIKNSRHVPRYCPEFQPQRSAQRRAAYEPQEKGTEVSTGTTSEGDRLDALAAAGSRYDAAIREVWLGISPDLGQRAVWNLARPGMVAAQQQLDADLNEIRATYGTGEPARTSPEPAARHDPVAVFDPPRADVRWDPAAKAGFDDAARTVAAQYVAGVDLDAIAAHHDDVSASIVADAQTAPGRSYAREYADTARSLIADLRADAAAARTEPPAPGTPHPDARLAVRGWQVDRSGVYVRVPPERQLEAG